MKTEIGITYKSQAYELFVAVPKRRNLASYVNELWHSWGPYVFNSENSPEVFNDDEYRLQFGIRTYSSAKLGCRVQLMYTIKPNDFNAIPENIKNELGELKSISNWSSISDLGYIDEIINKGYRIS